ncbi:O-methyltransferase [Devriesea agamarum]|uniref:O-methyltransferase n=1 Tax=Devriesea agamarum TaxID=472569 RepID=UPI00071C6651|nr:class I SAM-dependent methyltransferase [Devriesea agamarum]
MASGKAAGWAHCEEFVDEQAVFLDPSVIARARERGAELGAAALHQGVGAALRLLAATTRATAAVEIGTGAGVGSLYILAGMGDAGVLTTIDREVENQRAAREAFCEAGIRSARVRTIAGAPLTVLGRLTEGAYDMVVFSADDSDAEELLPQAVRLLRPGGVLVMDHALFHDRVADPAARDETTTRIRGLLKTVRESPDLMSALLPSGDGLLAAVRTIPAHSR